MKTPSKTINCFQVTKVFCFGKEIAAGVNVLPGEICAVHSSDLSRRSEQRFIFKIAIKNTCDIAISHENYLIHIFPLINTPIVKLFFKFLILHSNSDHLVD